MDHGSRSCRVVKVAAGKLGEPNADLRNSGKTIIRQIRPAFRRR